MWLIVDEFLRKLRTATVKLRLEEIDEEKVSKEEHEAEENEDEFYIIAELEGLENKSYAFMAKKFPNLRFMKYQPFKAKRNESSSKPWFKGNSSAKGFKRNLTKERELEMWIGPLWGVSSIISLVIWLMRKQTEG